MRAGRAPVRITQQGARVPPRPDHEHGHCLKELPMKLLPTSLITGLIAGLLLAAVTVTGQATENISKVNGRITVEAGQTVGKVSTVNGAIQLEAGARASAVETVNGSIRLERDARAGAIESVNGAIRLAQSAQVTGDLEAVNGAITLAPGVRIDGDVVNVNGTITLDAATLGGRLTTVNGTVLIGADSRIGGGIKISKPGGFSLTRRVPRVVIGPGARVDGDLVFEREVELHVHESAVIGPVQGATAMRYSGDTPPD